MRFIFFYLRESFVPQVKEKTSTRSMLHALDKGLADFDLSSQPRVRMAEAIVLTKHGPAMSLASSYSPLVEFILIYAYCFCQQKSYSRNSTFTACRGLMFCRGESLKSQGY